VDLSAGSVCGLCAVIMTARAVRCGLSPLAAVALAVICGAVIGAVHGLLFTRIGIPSFVVTLAGLIGWQGVQLLVLGREGTINLPFDGAIAKLSDTWLTGISLWVVVISVVGLYAAGLRAGRHKRIKNGLLVNSLSKDGVRALALSAVVVAAVFTLSLDRGVPLTFLLFTGAVAGLDLGLQHTILGRRIYAVGGNAEAARRAGINVTAIRIGAFAACSALAAVGGVLSASRLAAVNQSSGGSDLLLNAIASAVIGGVSLFGGRGRPYAALLGVLVIQSITNGMLLLNVDSSVRYMVTALVLVAAVAMDSLSRR
jgi:D-xylose transport system permease protein